MTKHGLSIATEHCSRALARTYGRNGRTNGDAFSPTRDTSSSVTHGRTYGGFIFGQDSTNGTTR